MSKLKIEFKSESVMYIDELVALMDNQLLENFDFVRDMSDSSNIITEVSKFNLNKYEHLPTTIFDVFKDVVKQEYNRNLLAMRSGFVRENSTATELNKERKDAIAMCISSIPRVYGVINHPQKKSGLNFDRDLRKNTYNTFREPIIRAKYLKFAGLLDQDEFSLDDDDFEQKSFNEHFDFENCKSWKILLENLTNPEKNKCKYQTGTGKDVNALEHFVKWLSIVSTKNVKTGILPIFISATPGAGKGVIQKLLFNYIFSNDYSTQITSKTLTGGFNSVIENKLFWMFDEGQIQKSEQVKVAGALKNLITEEQMIVEQKGKDQRAMFNCSNGLIASNIFAIPLDTDDRRSFVMETYHKSLEDRVTNEFGYRSINDFVKVLERERDTFLKLLFTFKFDHNEVLSRPVMTPAKRKMIYSTNTMTSNMISLIRNRDIKEIKDFFIGEVEGDAKVSLARLCEEVKGGFITNDSTSFLYDMLRNEKDKGMTKKLYWDKHFEASKTVNFTKLNGNKSSAQIRMINGSNYDKKIFEDYMSSKTATKEELDRAIAENKDVIIPTVFSEDDIEKVFEIEF